MSRLLLYTLLVKSKEEYLPMFRMMLATFSLYAGVQCDLLVIGTRDCLKEMRKLGRPQNVSTLHAMEVPHEDSLHDALLRKLDICDFSQAMGYDVILYMDVDILVQRSIQKILQRVASNVDVLHAVKEDEDFNHPFFGFERYTEKEKLDMAAKGMTTFNDGTFAFVPSATMLRHFRNIKEFAISNESLRNKYYDQSFFNDYFNSRGLVSTTAFGQEVAIFPEKFTQKDIERKTMVHFAGLGGYKSKKKRMGDYLYDRFNI